MPTARARKLLSPEREVVKLRRRLRQLEYLCADLYQFLGQANAPLRYLDAAAAAASGGPLPTKPLKRLTRPEIAAIGKEFGSR